MSTYNQQVLNDYENIIGKAPDVSDVTRTLLSYMDSARGNLPLRIFYSLCTFPLQYRALGPDSCSELSDDTLEDKFGGLNFLIIAASSVINRFLHADGTVQSFYMDSTFYRFLMRHKLLSCGLWDYVNTDIIDSGISSYNYDHRWAYSACKPLALRNEIHLSKSTASSGREALPVVFHDSDLILHRAVDSIMRLEHSTDVAFGYSHRESVENTDFYPPMSCLHLPARYTLQDGLIRDRETGFSYRTDLDAINTCLMYFSADGFAMGEEFAELFSNLMKDNFLPDYTWLKGEQNLLAFDQRTALMVCDRLRIDSFPIMPITWSGSQFIHLDEPWRKVIWRFYNPEYNPELAITDGSKRAIFQDINHFWNQKPDILKHEAYGNYVALIYLEVMRVLCPLVGLDWGKVEAGLSTMHSMRGYLELLHCGLSIEELLKLPRKIRPVAKTLIEKLDRPMPAPRFTGKQGSGE